MKPLWTSAGFSDPSHLRLIGRCAWEEQSHNLLVWHAGSGFEIAFDGTSVRIILGATPYDIPHKTAHVGIWIDDPLCIDPCNTVVIERDTVVFEATGLSAGYHVLKLLKRSEATDSTLRIHSIEIDGSWLKAPAAKPVQLEVLGASNSCGYGILGSLGQPKTTANSTVFAAFSSQTGFLLNADVSIVGASGWGVTRGYNTDGNVDSIRTLPFIYDYAGITPEGNATIQNPWNHTAQSYQAIILNMGSNDFNASNYFQRSQEEQAVMRTSFQTAYSSFLRHLRHVHPEAWIVCTYGMSNETTHFRTLYETIAAEANHAFNKIRALPMHAAGSLSQPFATDYHPNAAIHLENAKILAQCLREVLGMSQSG